MKPRCVRKIQETKPELPRWARRLLPDSLPAAFGAGCAAAVPGSLKARRGSHRLDPALWTLARSGAETAAATELFKSWTNKDTQMNDSHPETNMPIGYPPQYPPTAFQDQILIHQQIELLEVLTGFETNNKYEIKNSFGQRVYFAVEDTDCCTRNCCGPSRPFTLRIIDNMGQEVMTLERPLRCSSCCYPCCLQEIEIQAPPGVPVGYVIQTWHPCLPRFTIQNEKREDVLKISGPCVVCSCCGDVDFEIKSLDEQNVVGKISKHWTGILREAFTDADNFGIQFPLDLDVKMKAVMIGACFLIDFMFFESSGNQEQRSGVW
ncbi:phospholipid scramblase 1 isoform X2 [Sapajus apella]|uniref:Phospholipid scramblase n=1 Tax=Sapajus apella TaxID=9515 RepID=A0A6J3GR11_SAPAP|nr:phospholipid scramblase 1 isoform X2 [Sapajus apella]